MAAVAIVGAMPTSLPMVSAEEGVCQTLLLALNTFSASNAPMGLKKALGLSALELHMPNARHPSVSTAVRGTELCDGMSALSGLGIVDGARRLFGRKLGLPLDQVATSRVLRHLREGGQAPMAQRLQKASKMRRCIAHPDELLLADLAGFFEGSSVHGTGHIAHCSDGLPEVEAHSHASGMSSASDTTGFGVGSSEHALLSRTRRLGRRLRGQAVHHHCSRRLRVATQRLGH